MNRKGQEIMIGLVVFLLILVIIGPITIFALGLRDVGESHGRHTGYITAVEYNGNIIWDAELVYFKTDAESSQEDIYCVNDPVLQEKLVELSKTKKLVNIEYENDFLMWAWECNGGASIITGVESE